MSGNLALNVCVAETSSNRKIKSTGVLYWVQVFVYCFIFHIEFCQTLFIDGADDIHYFINFI